MQCHFQIFIDSKQSQKNLIHKQKHTHTHTHTQRPNQFYFNHNNNQSIHTNMRYQKCKLPQLNRPNM
jgi:hypothetical protein